ncbi:hypothetical protein HMPREF9419_0789 [Prevotella nigrescens ATCC 33563]|nr:hypothetical protein HMPREF9419_0789 [Prevotella nigrescens ATCC 33563]
MRWRCYFVLHFIYSLNIPAVFYGYQKFSFYYTKIQIKVGNAEK